MRWALVAAFVLGVALLIWLIVLVAAETQAVATWIQAGAAVAQAYWAVVAVAVAYEIGRHQSAAAQKMHDERYRDLFNGINAAVEEARLLIFEAAAKLERPVSANEFASADREAELEAAKQALEMIPLYEIGDFKIASDIVRLKGKLTRAISSLAASREYLKQNPNNTRGTTDLIEVRNSVEGLSQALKHNIGGQMSIRKLTTA